MGRPSTDTGFYFSAACLFDHRRTGFRSLIHRLPSGQGCFYQPNSDNFENTAIISLNCKLCTLLILSDLSAYSFYAGSMIRFNNLILVICSGHSSIPSCPSKSKGTTGCTQTSSSKSRSHPKLGSYCYDRIICKFDTGMFIYCVDWLSSTDAPIPCCRKINNNKEPFYVKIRSHLMHFRLLIVNIAAQNMEIQIAMRCKETEFKSEVMCQGNVW